MFEILPTPQYTSRLMHVLVLCAGVRRVRDHGVMGA